MRVRKLSFIAVALSAGLSLTACQGAAGPDGTAGDAAPSKERSSAPASPDRETSAAAASSDPAPDPGADGDGATASAEPAATRPTGGPVSAKGGGTATCTTARLGISSSHGMGEGVLNVNLKNNGSEPCALKGFAGVDLTGADGTVSADRKPIAPRLVTVQPGEETHFALYYPFKGSGGSGVTYTTMVVTPPNETHSKRLSVVVDVPVTDGSGPGVRIDPVGYGK
ncbi:DUF4232 domain-containing protein [Streptomyces sp. WG-D5]